MQAATLTLERLMSGRGSLSTLMHEYQQRLKVSEVAKYKELCFGSCRWYHRIQVIVDKLADRPLKKTEVRVRAILTVAVYQLMETRTPDYAVVNEAVDVARKLNKPWAKNCINAQLRRYIRSKRELNLDCEEYNYSHNPWYLDKVKGIYPSDWEQIIKANNHRPSLCLRVNLRRIKREDYLKLLGEQNIEAYSSEHIPSAVYLTKPMPVNKIPGFSDGCVSIQDEGAQLAGYLLLLDKDDRVLDACSAPGGKAGHLLESNPTIHLVALDNNKKRLDSVIANMARLKVFAHRVEGDASTLDWWDGRKFDAILLDAPCSCSGVVRRNVDIKLMIDQQRVDENRKIQLEMIQQLWQTLRDGGKLLYSTCSIFTEENEEVIEQFIATCGDAVIEPIDLPEAISHHKTNNGVQLLPNAYANDGFYFSMLGKNK